MRTRATLALLTVVITGSMGLSGCRHLDQLFTAGHAALAPDPALKPPVRPRSIVKRVARPSMVPAGSRIRSYCGQRHIRFHAGTLKESESEKARNDVLCQQT